MSTVLLGLVDPGFEVTTILWHHFAGVLAGSSLVGVAPGLIVSLSSGPVMPGKVWCGQVLNVEDL